MTYSINSDIVNYYKALYGYHSLNDADFPKEESIQDIINKLNNQITAMTYNGIRPRRIGQKGEPIEQEIKINLRDLKKVLNYIINLDDQLTKLYDERL